MRESTRPSARACLPLANSVRRPMRMQLRIQIRKFLDVKVCCDVTLNNRTCVFNLKSSKSACKPRFTCHLAKIRSIASAYSYTCIYKYARFSVLTTWTCGLKPDMGQIITTPTTCETIHAHVVVKCSLLFPLHTQNGIGQLYPTFVLTITVFCARLTSAKLVPVRHYVRFITRVISVRNNLYRMACA